MRKPRKTTVTLVSLVAVLVVAVVFGVGYFGGKRSTQFGSDFSPLTRQSRVVRFEKVALKIWGPVCGGDVVVAVAPIPQKKVIGQAFYVPRIEGKPFTKPFHHCSLVINSRRKFSDVRLCQIVVHEVGHLAGYRSPQGTTHSSDPRSIMYPKASTANVPKACR